LVLVKTLFIKVFLIIVKCTPIEVNKDWKKRNEYKALLIHKTR